MKSEWAAALDEALTSGVEKIEDGWLSHRQVAEQWGKSESHTRKLLSALMASGKVETRDFRIVTQAGIRKMIPYYRPIGASQSIGVASKNLTRTA